MVVPFHSPPGAARHPALDRPASGPTVRGQRSIEGTESNPGAVDPRRGEFRGLPKPDFPSSGSSRTMRALRDVFRRSLPMIRIPPRPLDGCLNDKRSLGVMLCGHGSRDALAVGEFAVAGPAARGAPARTSRSNTAISNSPRPVIRDGLDRLREGVTRILAVPGMLFAAGHAKNDIPSVLNTYAAEHGLRSTMAASSASISRCCAPPATASARRSRDRRATIAPARDAAGRRRPRRLRSRRQFQRRQGHAHAVGGHGLRLGRDRLFRRHLPAGRAGAASMRRGSATAASSSSPISCSPASW